jgi:hypothetical protein
VLCMGTRRAGAGRGRGREARKSDCTSCTPVVMAGDASQGRLTGH